VQVTDPIVGQRAMMASAFTILTSNLVIAGVQAAYDSIPTIGQELVTDIESNKRESVFVSIHAMDVDGKERIIPGKEPFPEIGASEEDVRIGHNLNGRKLSIHRDLVQENDLDGIISRVNALGEIANDYIEERTIKKATDHDGSASSGSNYVYRPQGTGTALFSATANTPGTRAPSGTRVENNALVDHTDIMAARTVLAAMKNNRGKRIGVPYSDLRLLVPDALVDVAAALVTEEYVRGVENQVNPVGPRGKFAMTKDQVVSTPKLDDLSSSAWYLGAFRRQLKRKWKLRMETVTLGQSTQAFLDSEIVFQARIAWDMEVGALDYTYVVQCLSGTTAPKDES